MIGFTTNLHYSISTEPLTVARQPFYLFLISSLSHSPNSGYAKSSLTSFSLPGYLFPQPSLLITLLHTYQENLRPFTKKDHISSSCLPLTFSPTLFTISVFHNEVLFLSKANPCPCICKSHLWQQIATSILTFS